MRIFKTSRVLILALSVSIVGVAQQSTPKLFPITGGRKDDGLPKKLRVKGTISQVDYASACGELIFAATFEVKLDGKFSGYSHPFVYIVVSCLYPPKGGDTFLNRRVEVTVTKQAENRLPCFYDRGGTPIDSGGLPFYCAARADLLKGIKSKSTSDQSNVKEFDGSLEQGNTYRTLIACDQTEGWHTAVRLKVPYHHAARIEWLNLAEFQQRNTVKKTECALRIVFEVVTKQIVKVSGQNRWNTTYECRILAVE